MRSILHSPAQNPKYITLGCSSGLSPLIFHFLLISLFLSGSLFLPERARWGERFLFSEALLHVPPIQSLKAFNSWGVWFYREGGSTSLPPPAFFRPSLFLWSSLTPSVRLTFSLSPPLFTPLLFLTVSFLYTLPSCLFCQVNFLIKRFKSSS